MSEILNKIKHYEQERKSYINLIASENVTSKAVDYAVQSDLSHRYAEGLPGKRLYPGNELFDEIEIEAQDNMKKLFGCKYVDLRPLSGAQANLGLYTAFTLPGDTIMRLATGKGGHISSGSRRLGGGAGTVRLLDTVSFGFNEDEMNIDVDDTKKIFNGQVRIGHIPKIALFGASVFLFPHPIKELADYMKPYGTIIAYDAAHVAGLIAGNCFQKPFDEGVDIMTMSTHKTFPGPQHGAILGSKDVDAKMWTKVQRAMFPALVSNHHLGAVAGVGIAAEEMLEYGVSYAENIIANAHKLAGELLERGVSVVCGSTSSHQVLVDLKDGKGKEVEKRLQDSHILANKNMLPWDRRFGHTIWNPSGIRIGVQEVTRKGMSRGEMEVIAGYLESAIAGNINGLKERVSAFAEPFQEVQYCNRSE